MMDEQGEGDSCSHSGGRRLASQGAAQFLREAEKNRRQ